MEKLLKELKDLNIKIKLVDGDIKIIALEGKLSNEIINKLKKEKSNLIEYLKNRKKPVKKIFTPSDFTYKKLTINEVNKLSSEYDIEDIYQLTPMQEGMLFHAIHDSDSLAYLEQTTYRLQGEFSVELVRNSLNELFKRYEILRTVFIYENVKNPIQIVLKNRECGFVYEDLRHLETEEKEIYVSDLKKRDLSQGFILDQDVLMRVSLLQLEDYEYELIWSHHHILMDGWCIRIINNDFYEIYNGLRNSKPITLPSVVPYKEYIKWLDNIEKEKSLKYWEKYLSGYEEQASLPYIARKEGEFLQKIESKSFSKEISSKIKSITVENNVTPNAFLQSIWSIVLGKYSSKEDMVFGSVVSGRPSEINGVETIVGLFINNVPVRIESCQDDTFVNLLKRVQNSNLDSELHHYISLAEIQSQSMSRQNLIDHIIVFQNYPIAENIEGMDNENEYDRISLKITDVDIVEQTNYNLTICASLENKLSVKFLYNSNVYDPEMMSRLMQHFEKVIEVVINDPSIKITEIDILSPEEKHQLLYEFNNTKSDYPKDKSIHQLFEEQVEKTPDNIAIVSGGEEFTYQDINEISNQLAHYLRRNGVALGDKVGLILDRSVEMITGIFGVIKSGGAYIPIDPSYPKNRINSIIDLSEPKLILSHSILADNLKYISPLILLDSLDIEKEEKSNTSIHVTPSDLLYIIFTSGSTGVPKGVQVNHNSLINLLYFLQEKYPIHENDSYLLKTSYCFDVSKSELFGWILGGGKLVILEKGQEKDANEVIEAIHNFQISHINFVPAAFNSFSHSIIPEEKSKLFSLKYIMLAGEALLQEHLQTFLKLKLEAQIENLYGPSEATVYTSYYTVLDDNNSSIPIGKPISNYSIYILDRHSQLKPIGVYGELCISGDGLSKGYLNNPELTQEKFIINPIKEGEYLYRTGDIARWLPDGNIEFLGRLDHQVKIRGYRIELGEIESALLKHNNVKECVVLDREENSNKYLCAYVVCKAGLNNEELRTFMLAQLPDYMIPSYFVELDKLPLTSNGKINRKDLPLPQIKAGDDYVAPSNEIEEKLVELWSEALSINKEDISVKANFFTLGGHSLHALSLVSKINKEFKLAIPLARMFENPTISRVAMTIFNLVEQEESSEKIEI